MSILIIRGLFGTVERKFNTYLKQFKNSFIDIEDIITKKKKEKIGNFSQKYFAELGNFAKIKGFSKLYITTKHILNLKKSNLSKGNKNNLKKTLIKMERIAIILLQANTQIKAILN